MMYNYTVYSDNAILNKIKKQKIMSKEKIMIDGDYARLHEWAETLGSDHYSAFLSFAQNEGEGHDPYELLSRTDFNVLKEKYGLEV